MAIHSGANVVRVIKYQHSPNAMLIGETFKIRLSNMLGEYHDFAYLVPTGKKPHPILFDLHYFYQSKHWAAVGLREVNGLLAIESIDEIKDKSQDELESAYTNRHKKLVTV